MRLDEFFIHDFETDARFANWYSYTADPKTDARVARVASGASGTLMSAHFAHVGPRNSSSDDFGVGVGVDLKSASGACADISSFVGLTFWAKASSGTSEYRFTALVPSQTPTDEGGDCTSNCYRHPSKNLRLTSSWTQYSIAWTDLSGPVPISNDLILGFEWDTRDAEVDLSIDEVAFY